MHFTPTIDIGNVLTILLALLTLYAAGRKWVQKVDQRFETQELRQNATDNAIKAVAVQVEKLDVQLDQQNLVLARMESSVVDPLRRFAALEAECGKQAKDLIRLETHVADTDRRLADLAEELRLNRDHTHKVANTLQAVITNSTIAQIKSEKAL